MRFTIVTMALLAAMAFPVIGQAQDSDPVMDAIKAIGDSINDPKTGVKAQLSALRTDVQTLTTGQKQNTDAIAALTGRIDTLEKAPKGPTQLPVPQSVVQTPPKSQPKVETLPEPQRVVTPSRYNAGDTVTWKGRQFTLKGTNQLVRTHYSGWYLCLGTDGSLEILCTDYYGGLQMHRRIRR